MNQKNMNVDVINHYCVSMELMMPIFGAVKEGGLADPSWRSFFILSLLASTLNKIHLTLQGLVLVVLVFKRERLLLYRLFDLALKVSYLPFFPLCLEHNPFINNLIK